jgi:hypothetical protein
MYFIFLFSNHFSIFEGVFRGHFRMDQNGQNLNRYYTSPDPLLQPAIFAAKSLLDYYAKMNTLSVYLDFHAHASKRGCFIYGNVLDSIEDQVQNQLFCKLISLNTPHFDYEGCLFSKEHMYRIDPGDQAKGLTAEGSGRVATYLAYGLIHSYTIECNYNTSRVGNEVPPTEQEMGGHDVTAATTFTTNPEKYTPASYAGVGRACIIAILDLKGHNPCSRIPKSKFKTLDRFRNAVVMEVRSRKEYFGKKLDRERRKSVQERKVSANSSPVPTPDDWIWKRVVDDGKEEVIPLSARSSSAQLRGSQASLNPPQEQPQQSLQPPPGGGKYLSTSEMFFISAAAGASRRKTSAANPSLPIPLPVSTNAAAEPTAVPVVRSVIPGYAESNNNPVKSAIHESTAIREKYVLSPGKGNSSSSSSSAANYNNIDGASLFNQVMNTFSSKRSNSDVAQITNQQQQQQQQPKQTLKSASGSPRALHRANNNNNNSSSAPVENDQRWKSDSFDSALDYDSDYNSSEKSDFENNNHSGKSSERKMGAAGYSSNSGNNGNSMMRVNEKVPPILKFKSQDDSRSEKDNSPLLIPNSGRRRSSKHSSHDPNHHSGMGIAFMEKEAGASSSPVSLGGSNKNNTNLRNLHISSSQTNPNSSNNSPDKQHQPLSQQQGGGAATAPNTSRLRPSNEENSNALLKPVNNDNPPPSNTSLSPEGGAVGIMSAGTSMRDLIREHSISKMIKLANNTNNPLVALNALNGGEINGNNSSNNNPVQVSVSATSSAASSRKNSASGGSRKHSTRKILGKTLHAAGVALLINGSSSNLQTVPSNDHESDNEQQHYLSASNQSEDKSDSPPLSINITGMGFQHHSRSPSPLNLMPTHYQSRSSKNSSPTARINLSEMIQT